MNYRLFVLVLGTFIIGTDDFVIAGLLPSIANDMNVSIVAAGQLVTAFAIAYAVSAPVLGTLTFNMSVKTLLVSSMTVFTIANGFSAVVTSFEWLFVTRIIAALAAAVFTPLAMAASTSLVPDTMRGKALSFVIAGITVGLILGAPIGTWIGNEFTWRYSFWFVALVSLVTAIGVLLFLPRIEREASISIKERLKSFNKVIMLTLTVSMIGTTGGFMTYTYIAPLITEITSVQNISIFLFLLGIGALFGNLVGGYLTDRIGAPKTLKLSLLGFAILLMVFSLLTLLEPSMLSIVLVGLLSLLWGIPGFGMNPALNSFLISSNPKQASMILSFSASALYIGIGLGAILGGGVISITSVHYVGLGSGLLVLAAFMLFVFVNRAVHKKPGKGNSIVREV
ncbi:MFS transporter [Halalkalibacterium halodurans]|uniref:MFS transporter n=1 Tax=Halalkalibacterium halodurans TaxID=86665 RepID=UPI002E218065|nr:MFS transporter [Halalkalibacterium halodurans]MED4083368.1 MFS transporter [Halalkalibacterium halodurans]MED4105110.1 MFS transporter [Halalkalibacterium halodurans]MED4109428.1 MFS transporter [Halalkalibacterium halodurans]MED4124236.1 MFS transporter [Halalkalibacterium halodurans]